MRNLKKVLALVLAMAMSLSLAVTAGAAFNDQDKIVNEEAVDMCVALNIINGRTNGDFDPAGNVTRAEMAKMICIVLNGGKEPTTATKAVPTFADIDGHWAEGYIEYCFAKGVVAGKSATEFAPNAGVTGTEAAKMLLVALGYNADVEKMVGANWALYTNVLANQDGLYEELEAMDPGAALSRDNAAQMIWNALNAITMGVQSSIDREDGSVIDSYYKTGDTMLEAKYGTSEYEGVMTAFSYNSDKAEWTYTVGNGSFTTDEDFTALYQQDVKVIYKAKDVYGIFACCATVIAEGVIGDIEDLDKIKADTDEVTIDGVDYKLEKTTGYYFGAGKIATLAEAVALTGYEAFPFVAIDNDDDGKIDTLVVYPFTVSEITYVGSKTFTAGKSYTIEDVNIYEGFAKDDKVVITAAANTADNTVAFAKADVVSGEVTLKNGSDYTIGGEVYTAIKGLDVTDLALGNEVDVVVVNGYIFAVEKTSASVSMSDIVYINGTDTTEKYGDKTTTARAIFTDGTTAEIVLNTKESVANPDGLYSFEIEDDEYILSEITVDEGKVEGDFDAKATSGQTGDDRIAGTRANADAVVFVKDGENDVTVMTGADVMAWSKNTTVASIVAYANTTNGYNYVELAAVTFEGDIPGASADDVYGYVVAELGQTKEDNKEYTSFSVWTGAANETIKVESSKVEAGVVKGAFVKIADKDIDVVGTAATVDAFDGETVKLNGTEYKIVDDTKIVYVNTDDVVGAEGGSISEATDHNTAGTYEKNVVFVADAVDTDELVVLFVDVNNELAK